MSKYGEVLEDGTLRFVRILPGPIGRVWSFLVDPDKRAKWLCGGGAPAAPGTKFEFHFQHQNLTPHDDPFPEAYKAMESGVSYQVEVLANEPPNLLRLLWPNEEGGDGSEVTFRLSEQGDKVKLELLQKRVPSADQLFGASAGWHVHFGILEARLEGDDPWPFWAAHEKYVDEYKKRLKDAGARLGNG